MLSAGTAMSDDAILLKLEEDFTCPITQVSLSPSASAFNVWYSVISVF